MQGNEALILVPVIAELMLLQASLLVCKRLRELQVNGVSQLALAAIMLDAMVQAWQLWERTGRPAGVVWLLHVSVSYMMVYILYRLGELLGSLCGECTELDRAEELVAEGGRGA